MNTTGDDNPKLGMSEMTTTVEVEDTSSSPLPGSPLATSSHKSGDFDDEEALIGKITTDVQNQEDIERDITQQAAAALLEAEDKKDEARVDKIKASIARLDSQRRKEQEALPKVSANSSLSRKHTQEIAKLDAKITAANAEIDEFKARLSRRYRDADAAAAAPTVGKSARMPGESQREYLIRTGKITPFANVDQQRLPVGTENGLADAMLDAEQNTVDEGPSSHQVLRRPGFEDAPAPPSTTPSHDVNVKEEFGLRNRKKRRIHQDQDQQDSEEYRPSKSPSPSRTAASPSAFVSNASGGGEDDDDDDDDDDEEPRRRKAVKKTKEAKVSKGNTDAKIDLSRVDDGDEAQFNQRLLAWVKRRSRARRARKIEKGEDADEPRGPEHLKPCPDCESTSITSWLKVPGDIYPQLFGYQKTGVQWLAELHEKEVGGIIADEMGLGKTIQIIAFIAALHHSGKLREPVIIVAPASVLRQWVNEFHRWWPALRVSILHASGSGMVNLADEYDEKADPMSQSYLRKHQTRSERAAAGIIDRVLRNGHVLVTTYAGINNYADFLVDVNWGYAVLDEGHMIRNPNAEVTVACKSLRTRHRIILSGTPVQNNLTELWSLFDFVYPLRLGTLSSFRNKFAIPIKQGGYANASMLQIMTAEQCAETLKETISLYLLQRLKVDVAADLPPKTEQVLFVNMTETQHRLYSRYIDSEDVGAILRGKKRSLAGIDTLRKICNHPDLLHPERKSDPTYRWADPAKSRKLVTVLDMLRLWRRTGHKALLFSQSKLMLNIIQTFLAEHAPEITYVRMDGETPVEQRQPLIDRFNTDPELHVFLLTTRTGGLGVNLTGADRIIIYDPDWNPSTDVQARERAWRLGQTKPVSIYRLMTKGTIEEKIYKRQIFKGFMANKVLHDPKQRANLDMTDLHDLFTPPALTEKSLDTQVFANARVNLSKDDDNLRRDSKNGGGAADQAQDVESSHVITRADDDDDDTRQISTLAASAEAYVDDPAMHNEKRMMAGIFARSVASAYEHEQIVAPNGRVRVRADPADLRVIARDVAREGAQLLQQAAQDARALPIGVVTWTGEVGEAGRPRDTITPNSRRGRVNGSGPGNLLVADGGRSATSEFMRALPKRYSQAETERLIVNFLKTHGGKAPTQMIIDHFGNMFQGRQVALFQDAIHSVATIHQRSGPGRSLWELKEEFR